MQNACLTSSTFIVPTTSRPDSNTSKKEQGSTAFKTTEKPLKKAENTIIPEIIDLDKPTCKYYKELTAIAAEIRACRMAKGAK